MSSDKLTVQDSKFQLYLTELGSCRLGGKTQDVKVNMDESGIN